MEPLSRGAFAEAFSELDATERGRFVRLLWEARGWTVDGDDAGGRFVAVSPSGERRTLLVGRSALESPDADASRVTVVDADGEYDAPDEWRVVDAAELRRRALYAVDADARADLFEVLGVDPVVESDDEAEEESVEDERESDDGGDDGGSDDEAEGVGGDEGEAESDDETNESDDAPTDDSRYDPATVRVLVVAGVVVLCLTAGAWAASSLSDDGRSDRVPTPDGATGEGATWTPQNIERTGGNYLTGPTADGEGDPGTSSPPGIEDGRIVDSSALASAHRENLPESYRLVVTYTEFRDGRPVARVSEVVDVESPSTYRTSAETLGRPTLDIGVPDGDDVYADGSAPVERVADDDGSELGSFGLRRERGPGRYRQRVSQYVEWFLSVESSTVVDVVERDGRRYYWVSFDGDPWTGSVDETGGAVVRSDGVVRSLRREWTDADDRSVRAVLTVEYVQFGNVTVSPPAWYNRTVPGVENETASPTTPATATVTATATNRSGE